MPVHPRRLIIPLLALACAIVLLGAPPASAAKVRTVPSKLVGSGPMPYTVGWTYDVNDKGVGYAAWASSGPDKRAIMVARRSKSGSWSKARRLTGAFSRRGKAEYAGYSEVAVDARGRATLVWPQSKGKSVRIMVATTNPSGRWSKPRALSPKGTYAAFPRVAVSAEGHTVVQWTGDYWFGGNNISVVTTYRAPGANWEKPVRLDTDASWTVDSRPETPVIDDRGVATLVWPEIPKSGYTGTQRLRVATRASGTGWTTETIAEQQALSPQVAVAKGGDLVVAWTGERGIDVRRRAASGTWGAIERVESWRNIGNVKKVAISPSGRVAVSGEVLSGTLRPKKRPFLVVQDAPGGTWDRSWADQTLPEPNFNLSESSLVVAPGGAVTMTWERQLGGGKWAEMRVRRLTGKGSWGPIRNVGNFSMNPVVAVDGRGRFSMVYGEGGGSNRKSGGCCFVVRGSNLGS